MQELSLEADLSLNPELLGQYLNKNYRAFQYASFSEFLEKRNATLTKPQKPNRPLYNGLNNYKKQVYEQVWQTIQAKYNKEVYNYEQLKNEQIQLQNYEPSLSGYAQFLTENKKIEPFFLNRRYFIPVNEAHRRLHTYITGGTGSGKSEVIKSFIWHYLTKNTSTSLILLTPHGKIATEVAKMSVNLENDRLVYIASNLAENYYPCLNPFDIKNKDQLSDREAENFAESFREIFQELLQGIFTEQMNNLLKNTLPIMIKYPNSSIYNLMEILDPNNEKAEKYLNFANKHFKNKNMLDFLAGQFLDDTTYQKTKNAMLTRLQAIFGSTLMQGFMVGKTTIDLESLVNQRKLIIFNISKGEAPNEWAIIGKFVIASLKIISFKREKYDNKNFVPCHLFIDECQNYITDSMQEILEESRKYKLYLTLAQQTAGARMSKELLRSILGNTGIKITGRNGDFETLQIMAKSTGANLDDLKNKLSTGRFSLWKTALNGETQKPPYIVTMPTNTLDDKQSMTTEQWEAVKKRQLQAFYRLWGIKPPTAPKEVPQTQKNPIIDDFNLDEYLH